MRTSPEPIPGNMGNMGNTRLHCQAAPRALCGSQWQNANYYDCDKLQFLIAETAWTPPHHTRLKYNIPVCACVCVFVFMCMSFSIYALRCCSAAFAESALTRKRMKLVSLARRGVEAECGTENPHIVSAVVMRCFCCWCCCCCCWHSKKPKTSIPRFMLKNV